MVGRQTIFKYKTIRGPLHKLPPMLKLFLLLPLSIFCLALPSFWLCIGIITAIVIAFLCRFTLREQLTDLKPAVIYAVLMYSVSVFSNLFNFLNGFKPAFNSFYFSVFIPHSDYLRIMLRLTLIIQISALLFRTTSSMEIRGCLKFAKNISVFFMFIPEIFTIWSSIDLSWKARGGKQGIKKIRMMVFTLIALSFEKASIKSKALEARSRL